MGEIKPGHFLDRREAGRVLARSLSAYADCSDVIVMALPRGGGPVAYELALALHAPLDVLVVRKLGVPGYEELAMGAIATGGVRVLGDQAAYLHIPDRVIQAVAAREHRELLRRERLYRARRPPLKLAGLTVLLVDDGMATGASMRAAVEAVHLPGPARVVVAVPVASQDACDVVRPLVDELVCVITPEPFEAVGVWYADFDQTSDDEVCGLMAPSH